MHAAAGAERREPGPRKTATGVGNAAMREMWREEDQFNHCVPSYDRASVAELALNGPASCRASLVARS